MEETQKVPAQASPEKIEVQKAQEVIFQPNPGPQTTFLSSPEQEVLYGGAAGGGKAQPLYAKVATPDGWSDIGDLRVGSVVLTPDGGSASVVQIHPQGVKEIFTVTMQDGSTCEVTEDHLFYSKPVRDGADRWKVRSVKEMKESNRTFVIPLGLADRPDVELPLHPYLLGSLLGDGCITTNSVSFTTADQESVEELSKYVKVVKRSAEYAYGVHGVVPILRGLNLLGCDSYTKFIPEAYKFGSYRQRLGLIQGLMDTDGYVSADGKVNYTSVSKKLLQDVADLIRSVGGTATQMKGHTLYIRHPNSSLLFRLARKKDRCHPKKINNRIVSIEKTGEYPARCITISSKEQLYLTDNYIVTHNSYAMLADPVRYFNNPKARMLLVRRSTEELRELVAVSKELYPRAIPGIKFLERDKTWVAPSGATLWLSYLDRDDDVSRYQGQAYTWIGFDELTQWPTPYAWDYMRTRLRTSKDSGLKLYQRACVDEGNVLTESGWKDIRDVREGERVYSLNSAGELELKKVTGFYEYEVSEELVRVKKKNLYLSMTPDHRVCYRKQNSKNFELVRFNEHESKSIDIARTSLSYTTSGYKSPITGFSDNEYAEFLGLYIAEGSVNSKVLSGNHKVIITQNKKQNHQFVRRVMEASGLSVCYSQNGDFQINNKTLRQHLLPLGKAHDKHFPREFLSSASKEQLLLAFNAYALGDGHWQSDKSCTLTTVSFQLAKDLLEISVKLGYKAQYKKYTLDNPNHRDKYVVYVSLRGCTTRVDKGDIRNDVSLEDYTGKVYCLGVEGNENFILEQQGFVWVSGNTTNPGGPGHQWVRKMFVDPAPPGKPFWARDWQTGEVIVWPKGHSMEGQPLFKRRFIPATLHDNPYLSEDGMYEANLLSMPEHLRKQLLEGNWDINEGAAFPEFNRKLHVVEPFDIPGNWTRFRAADYGYGSYTGVLWFAVSPSEQLIVYRELYVSRVLATDLADMILELEEKEKIRYGVLDSSLWHNRGDTGPSLAEQMIIKGCRWRPADRSRGSRVAGKNEIHRRLQIDDFTEEPRMVIFNTCTNLISQLPSIPLDKNNPEDVDTKSEDHLYDALRYGVQTRPRSSLWDFDPNNQRSGFQAADPVMGY